MKTKYIISLLCILIILFQISDAFSQAIREFKSDTFFIEDLEIYLTNVSKDKGQELVLEFSSSWNNGIFTQDQKDSIFSFSNILLKRFARPFPHVENFMRTYIAFDKNNISPKSYKNWEAWFVSKLYDFNISTSILNDYFKFTIELLNNNIINKTSAIQWKADSAVYEFTFKDDLIVEFGETTLGCFFSTDSNYIYNTKGHYYPEQKKWIGKGGLITWERSGLSRDSVFATLGSYSLNMKSSEYVIDSVLFVNKEFRPEPLLGRLEDKVVIKPKPEKILYPKFDSYDKAIEIKNFVEGIDYEGGYSMYGRKFLGKGSKERKAKILIHKGDSVLLKAQSIDFGLSNNQIIAENTEITIPVLGDSIHHKNLRFKYFIDKKEIALIRNKKDLSQVLYTNTYHNFNMDVELVNWNIDSTMIKFWCLPGSARNRARFISTNYFSEKEYNKMQGHDRIHPLAAVRAYSNRNQVDEFTAEDLSAYLKRPLRQVHQMLIQLYFWGFIDYDIDKRRLKTLPLLEHYILARINKKDFDIINIYSDTTTTVPNATLDLKTYELNINGADSVPLNSKLRKKAARIIGDDTIFVEERIPIAIKPKENKITMKKGRNFEFDGELKLGDFQFVGRHFKFDYNNFRVDLDSADFLSIKVDMIDSLGQPKSKKVVNKIQDIRGYVLIDEPDNKSGNIQNLEYPIFNSLDTSNVYYCDTAVQEVSYDSTDFYFEIDPYEVDSMFEFTTEDWVLPGTFKAGGVIPNIRENLVIVTDTTDKFKPEGEVVASFGFERSIDESGIELYGNKGKFYNNLKLSMKGLRGKGDLDYLTSRTKSDDFIFYKDSMYTEAIDHYLQKASDPVEFPSAFNEKLIVQWYPNDDKMLSTSQETPFNLYKDEKYLKDTIRLDGTLELKPQGLSGWGLMNFENANLESNMFDYQGSSFGADTANFILLSLTDEGQPTFETMDVNAQIDLVNKRGIFKANDKNSSFATFPQNQYKCFMGWYYWYMEQQRIDIINNELAYDQPADTSGLSYNQKEDLSLIGSKFVSINPEQDSLSFFSPRASYDMEKKIIVCDSVKHIRVADATVYPSLELPVVIEEEAVMKPLEKSKIVADTLIRLHTITDAFTSIVSRKDYSASGKYEYVDYANNTQLIGFDLVYVDSTHTRAKGIITKEQNFRLSPEFAFDGTAELFAQKKHLTFSGFTSIEHSCSKLGVNSGSFTFSAEISPDEIYIPVQNEMKDLDGKKIYSGVFMGSDSAYLYPALVSPPTYWDDRLVATADGYLYYDKSKEKYEIASKEKLNNKKLPGNYFEMGKYTCAIYAEGQMDMAAKLGQVKLTPYGEFDFDKTSDNASFDLFMGIDFFFPKQAVDIMAETFQLGAYKLDPFDLTAKRNKKILEDLIGKDKTKRIIDDLVLRAKFNVPKELQHTITISELHFEWNTTTQSYRSKDKIGILSIGDVPINKKVEGFIEILKDRRGDVINIYFRIDRERWFYFTYKREVLQSISSIEKFNNIIIDTKDGKRKQKVKRNETPYAFYPSTNRIKNNFLARFMDESKIDDMPGNEQIIELPEEGELPEDGKGEESLEENTDEQLFDTGEDEKLEENKQDVIEFEDDDTNKKDEQFTPEVEQPTDEKAQEDEPQEKKKRFKLKLKKKNDDAPDEPENLQENDGDIFDE